MHSIRLVWQSRSSALGQQFLAEAFALLLLGSLVSRWVGSGDAQLPPEAVKRWCGWMRLGFLRPNALGQWNDHVGKWCWAEILCVDEMCRFCVFCVCDDLLSNSHRLYVQAHRQEYSKVTNNYNYKHQTQCYCYHCLFHLMHTPHWPLA